MMMLDVENNNGRWSSHYIAYLYDNPRVWTLLHAHLKSTRVRSASIKLLSIIVIMHYIAEDILTV